MTQKLTHKREDIPNPKPKRARMTLECSLEQRKAIRIMAAQNDQSMNDFILSLVEREQKSCRFCETYGPNEETIKAIKQIENGENLEHHASPQAFWDSFYKDSSDV